MPGPIVVPQGVISLLRGSLTFPGLPGMNITASYLGKRLISATFSGDAAMLLQTATGAAVSPEPYQEVELEVNLVKSQALAQAWQAQQQNTSLIPGGCVWRTDAVPPGVSLFRFSTVIIRGVRNMSGDGKSPDYMLRFGAIWQINSSLYN